MARDILAAAADHRLYIPTRLLPDRFDIPFPYSPAPPPQANELLAAYGTAIDASLRSQVALDRLAVTIGAPSSILAALRASASQQVIARQAAENDSARGHAQAAVPEDAPPPLAGQLERILESMQITEPAMLRRAAAVNETAHDLLQRAIATSRKRDSLKHLPQPQIRPAPRRASRTAAKDLSTRPRPARKSQDQSGGG